MRQELRHHQESRHAKDGEISVLNALVEQWMGQLKWKGMESHPTPEASGARGGNGPPPSRHGAAGAPGGGGDPDDDRGGCGRPPDDSRKGRQDKRPAPQPGDGYDAENDKQFNLFSQIMANVLGQRTRVPAEPPAWFRNEKDKDIHM